MGDLHLQYVDHVKQQCAYSTQLYNSSWCLSWWINRPWAWLEPAVPNRRKCAQLLQQRERERERGATVAALNFSDHIYIYLGLPIASLHKQRYLQHFPASSISKIPLKSTPATGLWTWNPTELLHQAEWLSWLHPDARSTAWKNQCLQLETAWNQISGPLTPSIMVAIVKLQVSEASLKYWWFHCAVNVQPLQDFSFRMQIGAFFGFFRRSIFSTSFFFESFLRTIRHLP